MASGPITSWQIDGETMETVTEFVFWGSKITADSDCTTHTMGMVLCWTGRRFREVHTQSDAAGNMARRILHQIGRAHV